MDKDLLLVFGIAMLFLAVKLSTSYILVQD